MGKCKTCGRNVTRDLKRGDCSECAKMNYMYSQGAVTFKGFKEWEKNWITKF